MPSPVAVSFGRLIERIQPTGAELERIDRRYDTIRAKLAAVFPDARVSRIGSHARGTGVRGTSDLDVLLEVPRFNIRRAGNYTSSRALLRRVRDALVRRYPSSDVCVRGPAVAARFEQAPVDIVPSAFDSFHGSTKVIAIPDGSGGWMPTSPAAHGGYIRGENQRTGGQLRYLAQLVKFWRHTRATPLPIQSFHVEMLLATNGICRGARPYSACMADALASLTAAVFDPPEDPLGISGKIPVAPTTPQLRRALQALERAAEQAVRAVDAEARGRDQDAIRWWSKVFKGKFPKN